MAAYTDEDVERIMAVPGVIRSRRKIEAVINNARCVQRIRAEFGTFSDYLWGWTGGKTMLYKGHELGHIPASNDLSDRIAKDLKKRGMKYIGSVTVYAHLQACGIVNDHVKECFDIRSWWAARTRNEWRNNYDKARRRVPGAVLCINDSPGERTAFPDALVILREIAADDIMRFHQGAVKVDVTAGIF